MIWLGWDPGCGHARIACLAAASSAGLGLPRLGGLFCALSGADLGQFAPLWAFSADPVGAAQQIRARMLPDTLFGTSDRPF